MSYYVYDAAQGVLKISPSAICRDYSVSYPIRGDIWHQLRRTGEHALFSAASIYANWRTTPRPIVVICLQKENGPVHIVWAVRCAIDPSLGSSGPLASDLVGKSFLWPVDHRTARSLFLELSADEHYSTSQLVTDLAPCEHNVVDWLAYEAVSKVERIPGWRERAMLLALKPGLWSTRVVDERADQVRTFSVTARPTGGCSLVETLPTDITRSIVESLTLVCINTRTPDGHRDWRALRSTCKDFRNYANATAVRWVEQGVRFSRAVQTNESVEQTYEMRDFLLASGLDSLMCLAAFGYGERLPRAGSRAKRPLSAREALLVYMRLRAGLPQGTLPRRPPRTPRPPPPQPQPQPVLPSNVDSTTMTRMHFLRKASTATSAGTQTRRATFTSKGLKMGMDVPVAFVSALRKRGWEEV